MRRACSGAPSRRLRAGHSLVELIVALAIGTMVLGILGRILVQQQRLYHGVSDLAELRSRLRQGQDVLTADLRSLAPGEGDIFALADTVLEIRSVVGSAVICAISPARNAFDVPPRHAYGAAAFAGFATWPDPGDTAWVHAPGASNDAADDRWDPVTIAAAMSSTIGCPASPFIDPTLDAGHPRVRVVLAGGETLAPDVTEGSIVRITRRVRWALYPSSVGWQLGHASWIGGGYSTIQPVAGPFLPRGAAATGGVGFRYFDEHDIEIVPPAPGLAIRRVAIAVRGATGSPLRIDGMRAGVHRDSLLLSVAVRNPR